MPETYKYLLTQISTFGSLPTHKVFLISNGNKTKLIFSDNTYIYSTVSDWALSHSGLDSRMSKWSDEPKAFLEGEKTRLDTYRRSHPEFITEVDMN